MPDRIQGVALVSDLDIREGVGLYGKQIYNHLRSKLHLDYYYLDFDSKSLVRNPSEENQTVARIKGFGLQSAKFKPLFWKAIIKHLPQYQAYHVISENLSFLFHHNFIVTAHNPIPAMYGSWLDRRARIYLYSGLKRAFKIIVPSYFAAGMLVVKFRLPVTKIEVIYQGISSSILKPIDKAEARRKLKLTEIPAPAKIVLNVAIESPRKNIPNLLRAFKVVSSQVQDAYLLKVGKPLPASVKLSQELGIQDRIIYLDRTKSEEEMALIYNAADLLLFPSYVEGFGLPPVEAMACGVPVITSSTSSTGEIFQRAGWLVHPDDWQKMGQAAVEVLTKPETARRLSEDGLKYAQLFDWKATAAHTYERVYQPLLEAAGTKAAVDI